MHATTPANQHTSLGSRPKRFRREFRQQGSLVNNPTKRRRTTSSHQIKSDGNHPGRGQKRNNRKEIRAGRYSRKLSAAQTLGASKKSGRRSIFTLTVLYAPAKVARKRHVNALKKDARNYMEERGGSTVQTPPIYRDCWREACVGPFFPAFKTHHSPKGRGGARTACSATRGPRYGLPASKPPRFSPPPENSLK